MCPLRVLVLALSVMVAAFTLYSSQVGDVPDAHEKSKHEAVSNGSIFTDTVLPVLFRGAVLLLHQ